MRKVVFVCVCVCWGDEFELRRVIGTEPVRDAGDLDLSDLGGRDGSMADRDRVRLATSVINDSECFLLVLGARRRVSGQLLRLHSSLQLGDKLGKAVHGLRRRSSTSSCCAD